MVPYHQGSTRWMLFHIPICMLRSVELPGDFARPILTACAVGIRERDNPRMIPRWLHPDQFDVTIHFEPTSFAHSAEAVLHAMDGAGKRPHQEHHQIDEKMHGMVLYHDSKQVQVLIIYLREHSGRATINLTADDTDGTNER